MPVLVAQIGGNGRVERLRLHALRDAARDAVEHVADIDRHQDIRRRVCAFRRDAFGHAFFDEDGIDLDAGLFREEIE